MIYVAFAVIMLLLIWVACLQAVLNDVRDRLRVHQLKLDQGFIPLIMVPNAADTWGVGNQRYGRWHPVPIDKVTEELARRAKLQAVYVKSTKEGVNLV